MTSDTKTIERILLCAAMLGTVVSVFTAGAWFGLWLGSPYLGFALAVVVDVGMFAAILASRHDKGALWIVGMLAIVSWAANAQHALLIHNGGTVAGTAQWMALDVVTLVNALVVTAIAPVAALALAMLYHRSAARAEVVSVPASLFGYAPDLDLDHDPAPAPAPVVYKSETTDKPKPARKTAPRPAGQPREWEAPALALLRDGLAGAEIARRVGVDPAQVSRLKARMGGQAVAQ